MATDFLPPSAGRRLHAVERAMRERGLNQSDLAARVGRSPSHISLVISGKKSPSLKLAAAIAREVSLPLEALVCGDLGNGVPYTGEPCLDCGLPLKVVDESESRATYRCEAGHAWSSPAGAPADQLSLFRCPALDERECRG